MKKQTDFLGVFLAAVTGLGVLAAVLLRTFCPRIILPGLDLPMLVALNLTALVLDHYLAGGSRRSYWLLPVYGALIFGLFPLVTGFVIPVQAGILALLGAVSLPVVTLLFDACTDRLKSAPVQKLAPLVSALGLFLACQCLMGLM